MNYFIRLSYTANLIFRSDYNRTDNQDIFVYLVELK